MMMEEGDSEQVLDIAEDGMHESSDDESGEGDGRDLEPGSSHQEESELDDSVHCFTGHTGIQRTQNSGWDTGSG